ncbi:TPA: hypothetical protein NGS68_002377 [Vibrio parahaemolyticus]|uniref:hypothetical protein n=1 Tax=Vibrio parahaemolyticus TaxID=670 RepID=UPI0004279B56|nr:hypothetical protein [Vibrio parahaemolyticus]HCE1979079.1 hypothetical protein [Vibrio parahaemolyticus]HCG6518893.1 hypothetical protein [Vibrio parahaemolyticus]HCG6657966.1 hypothetical protein [Vibrio parahaemolyticus]HCH0088879.1 hypothetical protein [Vibrio parahaemolyticus]
MNTNKKSDFLTDFFLNLMMVIFITLILNKLSIACTADFMTDLVSGSMNEIVLAKFRNESGEVILIKSNIIIILNILSVICAYISKLLLYISPILAFAVAVFQNYVKVDSKVEQEIEVKAIKNRITKIINSFDFEETHENVFLASCNEHYKGKVQSLSEEFEQLKADESCSLKIEQFEEMHRMFQEIQKAYLNDIEHIKNIESLGYITENQKISNTLHTI